MEWSCDRVFYVTTQSARERRLLVVTEYFYVATELARPGVFYRDKMFFCRDRVWPNGEVLCCDRAILCCDIVGQAGKIFCHD